MTGAIDSDDGPAPAFHASEHRARSRRLLGWTTRRQTPTTVPDSCFAFPRSCFQPAASLPSSREPSTRVKPAPTIKPRLAAAAYVGRPSVYAVPSRDGPHPHLGLPRLPPAPQARPRNGSLRGEHLGRGVPADRPLSGFNRAGVIAQVPLQVPPLHGETVRVSDSLSPSEDPPDKLSSAPCLALADRAGNLGDLGRNPALPGVGIADGQVQLITHPSNGSRGCSRPDACRCGISPLSEDALDTAMAGATVVVPEINSGLPSGRREDGSANRRHGPRLRGRNHGRKNPLPRLDR